MACERKGFQIDRTFSPPYPNCTILFLFWGFIPLLNEYKFQKEEIQITKADEVEAGFLRVRAHVQKPTPHVCREGGREPSLDNSPTSSVCSLPILHLARFSLGFEATALTWHRDTGTQHPPGERASRGVKQSRSVSYSRTTSASLSTGMCVSLLGPHNVVLVISDLV